MRPMDYETFDFISPELGFAFFTEFVSSLLISLLALPEYSGDHILGRRISRIVGLYQ